MLEIVYKLLKADTVLIMDYCVYCTEEIGDLTQITLTTRVSQVYICTPGLTYMMKTK